MRGFVFTTCFALLVSAFNLQAQFLVVPNAWETVDAASENRFPFLVDGGMRYQQVYNASEFTALAPGGEFITGMAFRLSAPFNTAFSETVNNVTVSFSTILASADSLSATFASNIGGDETAVLNNANLTLSSTNPPGPGDTRGFDVEIPFTSSFFYNPANGNLLLDVLVQDSDNNDLYPNTRFDAPSNVPPDSISRLLSVEGSPLDPTGTLNSLALVTRFTTVPEPGTTGLLLFVFGLSAFRRRR